MSSYIVMKIVRLQVVIAASMKMRAFCDTASCSFVGVYRRFRGAYSLHHLGSAVIALMWEAVGTSETSVYSNQTTRRHIPQDSHRYENCLRLTKS
jgi:hypothetical protein